MDYLKLKKIRRRKDCVEREGPGEHGEVAQGLSISYSFDNVSYISRRRGVRDISVSI